MKKNKDGTYTITNPTDFIGWDPCENPAVVILPEQIETAPYAIMFLQHRRSNGEVVIRQCIIEPARLIPVEVTHYELRNK